MKKMSKHWIVMVLMCGLSASAIGICANCLGVFYTPMSNELNVLRGTLANGSTISSFITAIISLFILKLINEKNYKLYLTAGVLLASISTALFSSVNSIGFFYVLNIIRGFGVSAFGAVIYTTIINKWFKQNLGLATSIVMSFAGILGALGAPVFNMVIEMMGWRTGFVIMGVAIFLFCLPAILYRYSIDPQNEGLLPYGETQKVEAVESVKVNGKFNYFSVSFITVLIFSLTMSTFTGISMHLSGFAESIGLSSSVGAFMISLAMIGNISGKLIVGSLSDRIGWFKSVMIMMSIVVVAAGILLVADNAMIGYAGSLLIGINYSVVTVGLVLITKNIFGSENYTRAYPVISFLSSIGSAMANSLVAYAYDFTGKYNIVFIAVLMISALGYILLITAYKTKGKAN